MDTCKRPTCDMKPQGNAKHGYCRKHARTENAANPYVPAAPTVARLHALLDAGWSCAAIADTIGISTYAVYNLRDNKQNSVRKTTAQGIARINPRAHTGATWVPAWPTVRRVRSLQAAGLTQTELAAKTGLTQTEISKISTARTHVTHETAAVIATLWDEIADQPVPGPPTRLAQRRKWSAPMDWDDIDDPDEHRPAEGALVELAQVERERALLICDNSTEVSWPHQQISYAGMRHIAIGRTARTTNAVIDLIYQESDRLRGIQAKRAKVVRHAA